MPARLSVTERLLRTWARRAVHSSIATAGSHHGLFNSDGAFLGAAGSITNQSGGIITSTSSDAVDANVVQAGDKVTIDNSVTLSGGGRGVYIGASGSLVADSLIMNCGSGAILQAQSGASLSADRAQ